MSSPVDTAVGTFLAEVKDALAGLRSDFAALPPKAQRGPLGIPFGSRYEPSMTPESRAMRKAATAIRDAERRYSLVCLALLARAGADAGAESVIEARQAGDAIVRLAASAFRAVTGDEYVYDHITRQLLELADRLVATSVSSGGGRRMGPGMSSMG